MKDKLERFKLISEISIILITLFFVGLDKSTIFYLYDFKYWIIAIITIIDISITGILIIKRTKPSLKYVISVVISFSIIIFLMLNKPYPMNQAITVSGFYEDIDGHYFASAEGDNFGKSFENEFSKVSKELSLADNPAFEFIPKKVARFVLPEKYTQNMLKKDIVKNLNNVNGSVIAIVGFVKNKEIDQITYLLNKRYFRDSQNGLERETDKVNKLIQTITDNIEINDDEKLHLVSWVLFIDFNAREIYQLHLKAFESEVGSYMSLLMNEMHKIYTQYPFIKNEMDYYATSILIAYLNSYFQEMPYSEKCDLLINALELFPYYPYFDENEYATYYIEQYYKQYFKTTNSIIQPEPAIYLLKECIMQCVDRERDALIESARKRIFDRYNSSILYISYLDYLKIKKPILDYDKSEIQVVNEMDLILKKLIENNRNEKLNDFLVVKQCMYYSTFIGLFEKLGMGKEANEYYSRINNILEKNQAAKIMFLRIASTKISN